MVMIMLKERFRQEKHYQVMLAIAKEMFRNGLITLADYRCIEEKIRTEYNPVFPDNQGEMT